MFGFAQDVAPTPAPKSKNKESVRIYRRYEKSKNETITETRPMPIFGNILGGLDMNVFYTYLGKSSTTPQSVTINFTSSNPEHEHRRDLIVKADGEVYQLGTMEYRRLPDSNFGFPGKLSLSIPVEAFNRIANAKKVHMKLGTEDFDLEERHIKKLRGLASAMTR
ncbi:MAG: hypothetical protein LC754_06405 [Acidobacteria bacterium]|nr:hypothetical protein [Acidobacteriota bacterium]